MILLLPIPLALVAAMFAENASSRGPRGEADRFGFLPLAIPVVALGAFEAGDLLLGIGAILLAGGTGLGVRSWIETAPLVYGTEGLVWKTEIDKIDEILKRARVKMDKECTWILSEDLVMSRLAQHLAKDAEIDSETLNAAVRGALQTGGLLGVDALASTIRSGGFATFMIARTMSMVGAFLMALQASGVTIDQLQDAITKTANDITTCSKSMKSDALGQIWDLAKTKFLTLFANIFKSVGFRLAKWALGLPGGVATGVLVKEIEAEVEGSPDKDAVRPAMDFYAVSLVSEKALQDAARTGPVPSVKAPAVDDLAQGGLCFLAGLDDDLQENGRIYPSGGFVAPGLYRVLYASDMNEPLQTLPDLISVKAGAGTYLIECSVVRAANVNFPASDGSCRYSYREGERVVPLVEVEGPRGTRVQTILEGLAPPPMPAPLAGAATLAFSLAPGVAIVLEPPGQSPVSSAAGEITIPAGHYGGRVVRSFRPDAVLRPIPFEAGKKYLLSTTYEPSLETDRLHIAVTVVDHYGGDASGASGWGFDLDSWDKQMQDLEQSKRIAQELWSMTYGPRLGVDIPAGSALFLHSERYGERHAGQALAEGYWTIYYRAPGEVTFRKLTPEIHIAEDWASTQRGEFSGVPNDIQIAIKDHGKVLSVAANPDGSWYNYGHAYWMNPNRYGIEMGPGSLGVAEPVDIMIL